MGVKQCFKLREQHRLRVFENMEQKKICGREKMRLRDWSRLLSEKLHELYSSPNIIWVRKSRRIKWLGHVAFMGEGSGACRDSVGKPDGKKPHGRPRHVWEDAIKVDV
jgi:hypothetical protein